MEKMQRSTSTKKLKVLHAITLLEFGGAQLNTLYTVEHLDRSKFDVVLLSGRGAYLDRKAKSINDVRLYFLPFLIRQVRPLFEILAFIYSLCIFLKEKPDIVHTHSSKAGIICRWAAYFSGVPVIIHSFHGFGFNDYQKPITRWFFKLLERLTAFITTAFIAVSKENIKTALKEGISAPDKFHLIRSGIKVSNFSSLKIDTKKKKDELGISQDDMVVTMICPFKVQKDPLTFVEIARHLLMKIKNIKFLLVGDGELRDKIETKVNEYDMVNKFKLLGWREDVDEILHITDVFVLTSLWEGLPRTVIESLVCGVPVVASDVDGIRDVIRNGENGYLVKPRDVMGFVEKILTILLNKSFKNEMSEKAKKSIDYSFDIDYMVKQQEELYFALINSVK